MKKVKIKWRLIAFALVVTLTSQPCSTLASIKVKEIEIMGNSMEVEPQVAVADVPEYLTDTLPIAYATPTSSPDIVKNQGGKGHCWACSAMTCAEMDTYRSTGEVVDYSTDHAVYHSINSLLDPLKNIQDTITPLQDFNKIGGNDERITNAAAAWQIPAKVKETFLPDQEYEVDVHMKDYFCVALDYSKDLERSENLANIANVKKMILEYGGGLMMYFDHPVYYQNGVAYFTNYTEEQIKEGKKGQANHGVTVVGWDDNYSRENFNLYAKPQNDGAWLCKNSRGTNVGDNGYFWISYEEPTIYGRVAFWDYQSADDYERNYQYDGTAFFDEIGNTNSHIMSAANVFTAGKTEVIKAVEFMTYLTNFSYTIRIYTDVEGEENPQNGTLARTQTGSELHGGYHQVALDYSVRVEKGEKFAIVITLDPDKTSEYAKIVHEGGLDITTPDGSNVSCNVRNAKGQSFIRYDSSENTWRDMYEEGKGNLRIKAFTDINRFTKYVINHDGGCAFSGSNNPICDGDAYNFRIAANAGRSVTDFGVYLYGQKLQPVNVTGQYAYYHIPSVTNTLYIDIYDLSKEYEITFFRGANCSTVRVIDSSGVDITEGVSLSYDDTLQFRLVKIGSTDLSDLVVKYGNSVLSASNGYYTLQRTHTAKTISISKNTSTAASYSLNLTTGTGVQLLSEGGVELTEETEVDSGEDMVFSVLPKEGYIVENMAIMLDNELVSSEDGKFQIRNIHEEHTIVVADAQLECNRYGIKSNSSSEEVLSGEVIITPVAPAKYIYDEEKEKWVSELVIDSQKEELLNPLKVYVSRDRKGTCCSYGVTLSKEVDNIAPHMESCYTVDEDGNVENRIELSEMSESKQEELASREIEQEECVLQGSYLEGESGFAKVEYYIDTNPGKKTLGIDELDKVDWEQSASLKKEVQIDKILKEKKKCVVYFSVIDRAGNQSNYYHTEILKLED